MPHVRRQLRLSLAHGKIRNSARSHRHRGVPPGRHPQKTLITGKDLDEKLYPDERETKQFLASAYAQFNNDHLKNIAGKPWMERSTDELFDLLDIFMPKTRNAVAAELAKRIQVGETAILPRLVELLTHENARYRHGALYAIAACGNDTVLSNLAKITPLLNDPKDFVRITAVGTISKASSDAEIQLALLQTAVADRTALAPNSVRNAIQSSLLKSEAAVSKTPFKTDIDEALVTQALSNLILEETGGGPFVSSKIGVWDKDTLMRLAGPLTYIAEEEQVFDQMFGARNAAAQAMLGTFGYLEGIQTNGYRIRKKAEIPRSIRAEAGFKDPMINPDVVAKQPGVFADLADEIRTILIDNPLEEITIKDESTKWLAVTTPLSKVLKTIEGNPTPAKLPSIADDVRKLFRAELDAADGTGAKIKLCRAALADPESKNSFRQIAAMDALVELLDAEALEDLLPYLGGDYWRTRDHSRTLAGNLVKSGAGSALIASFAGAKSPATQAGILAVLATAKHTAGTPLAKEAMKHDPATAAILRDALLKTKDSTPPDAKAVIFYLLARIGDEKSLAALNKLAAKDDPRLLADVAAALSYSPSREADQLMLDLAAASPKRAEIIAPHSVRRMVIGPRGYGDIPSAQRMDFADAMLKITLEPRIVKLLGSIHEARALTTLMFCLEKGVASAAESLITNAEGMEKLSPADGKIAAKALQDVIEYIEVTRLRGGIKAHMDKDDNYTGWKALQARAGKVLLKVHQPESAPIPGFDPLELND